MSYTVVPAVRCALTQATALSPRRSTTSDGTIGDTSHSARPSDHNPNEYDEVLAFDLTHDSVAGCDAHAMVRAAVARRDRRIRYAISMGRIWSAERADEGWRRYRGTNPHTKHAHVSIERRHRNDTSPWWTTKAAPPTPPAPTKEPDEMTPADWTRFERMMDDRLRILLRAEKADGTPSGHPNLRNLTERLDRIEKLAQP